MGPTEKQGGNVSPSCNLDQKGSGGIQPGSGGRYMRLSIAEIDKNVNEAQANNKEPREPEIEGTAKAMATWKRKERDTKISEEDGYGRSRETLKKRRKIVARSESKIGSGSVEAEIQSRQLQ